MKAMKVAFVPREEMDVWQELAAEMDRIERAYFESLEGLRDVDLKRLDRELAKIRTAAVECHERIKFLQEKRNAPGPADS